MGGGNGREQKRAANYSRIQRATRVADSRGVVTLIARLLVASPGTGGLGSLLALVATSEW